MIEKTESGYVVKSANGKKILGRHRLLKDAKAQLAAIEAAKARRR